MTLEEVIACRDNEIMNALTRELASQGYENAACLVERAVSRAADAWLEGRLDIIMEQDANPMRRALKSDVKEILYPTNRPEAAHSA
jgi:hypothetical protein